MVAIGTIYSLGIWTVKQGKESEFIRVWNEFAQWTKDNQDGAREAVLVQDMINPRKFFSFGPWRGLKDIDAWRKTKEFSDAFKKFRELCDDIQPNTLTCVAYVG
jgi:heme-degrading monooxygenase HmoA